MAKKIVLMIAAAAFVISVGAGISVAGNAGPADMVLKTSKGKKPATFPHKLHQDLMKCAECHHTAADGKKGPYVAGQEAKCESCHDGSLPGKVKDFKGAAHVNCKGCHKAGFNGKKGPTKCTGCHVKK